MACDLILALDTPSPREVASVLRRLSGRIRWAKIGLEMFTACGPDSVREVAGLGFQVFLDLKLHDIPNTVARAVEAAARLPVRMLTLHTAGGREMMRRAVEARQQSAPELLLLGVTVLTSLDENDLRETGVGASPEAQVTRLARLAVGCGLGGIVCSPLEIAPLRAQLPPVVKLVAPGIRPPGTPGTDDQARVMTPAAAARAGADFIVVGRSVFKAADPVAAAEAILAELGTA
ncbi:MAG TPA: orotidine-5'-phosphate decarboxylase [Opitutaceae bacterium]|nr:orotidine-5'-phosphate decarboxylase [Opitutaceae bacterium]